MHTHPNPILQDLAHFLDASPTAWHAIDWIKRQLHDHQFKGLSESEHWKLEPGQRYYVTRNGSSICAFITPHAAPHRVRLLASHTDSPGFKLKPQPEIRRHQAILFGVEVYGAPLLTSWLNRDLGLAGRVIYEDRKGKIREKLVRLDKHPLTIPQLAIHLDREVNEKGLILNKQENLNALAALEHDLDASQSYLNVLLREELDFQEIINCDLFLYPIEKARFIGWRQQMLAAYRLDSLASVHAALQAFLSDPNSLEQDIKMVTFWDNEEIGSHTAHGASSPFVNHIIERITLAFKQDREAYLRLLNQSACISIDLAHALHPNYADKHDAQHQLFLGKGSVLKTNSQYRYASDARSSLPIQAIARDRQIPLQKFVSRNDVPCGTTIGPIHANTTGMSTVDIGSSQLSMHSCRELISSQDHLQLCQLLKAVLDAETMPFLSDE